VVIVVYTQTEDHFVVGGVQSLLKIITYATIGENDFSKDK